MAASVVLAEVLSSAVVVGAVGESFMLGKVAEGPQKSPTG